MKRLETPCGRCGWKFPGFHVCVDLSVPMDPTVQKKYNDKWRSAEQLQRLTRMRDDRWARHREETAERDKRIIERYKEDNAGMKELSREFGIAFQTVRGILLRAQEQGSLIIRPQGTNVRFKKGYVA